MRPFVATASGKFAALLALVFLALSSGLSAQERVRVGEGEYAFDFQLFFPLNVSAMHPEYLENSRTLAKLDSIIAVHGAALVDSVKVLAFSSPEGGYNYNLRLAGRRAESMRDYLVEHIPGLAGKISLDFGVSAWPRTPEELERLRYAAFRLAFPFDITVAVPDFGFDFEPDWSFYALELADSTPVFSDPAPQCTIPYYERMAPRTIFALKTNMLYDLATALNAEIELPVGDRISFVWEDVFPWWESGNKYCLQMWEMGAEARYWFKPWDPAGTDKLRGFFAGLYGMSSKYDFQYDTSVNYQGEYWSAGLTGGWSTYIGRSHWGRLELSLGLGWLGSDWRHYYPTDIYDRLIRDRNRTGTLSYWGPTKAKVSLVVPVNVNFRKKERRHE